MKTPKGDIQFFSYSEKIKEEASINTKKTIILGAVLGAAIIIMISFVVYMTQLFKKTEGDSITEG